MASPEIALPPGATLVNGPDMALPPGARLVSEATSGTPKTDDDVIRAYGLDPAVIKKSHLYVPGHLADLANDTKPSFGNFAAGIGEGIYRLPAGIFQLMVHGANKLGLASDEDVQYNDLLEKVHSAAYRTATGGGLSSKLGELAGTLFVPVPGAAAKTLIGAVAKGAVTGAAAAAAQPVDVQEPGGDYFAPKARQAVIGAVTGAGTGGLVKGIGSGISRIAASRSAELPEEIAARAQAGVEAETGRLESAAQQTPFAGADDVVRAAAAGDKVAQGLQQQITSAKTPGQIQQASIGLMNWRTRQTASELYNKVDEAIAKHPELGDVPLDETEKTIAAELEKAQSAKDPDVHLINVLKTVQRNIGASGEPQAADQLVDNSYGQMRQFRSDLGERIATLRSGAGKQLLGPSSAGSLQQVRNAVDTDLRNFTANSGVPEVQRAADAADLYYAQKRVPFTASDIAKAGAPNLAGTTTDAEADQIFGKFIQAGKGDKAQRFFDALDPRGRASVQYQIAADAMNKATDPLRGTLDPEKFFNTLDKSEGAYGVFFQGPDKAIMDGLKNLARQAVLASDKEAAAIKKLNQPGMGVLGPTAGLAGAYALGSHSSLAGTVATVAGLASIARSAMLTPAGRRLLADASTMAPGNPQLAKILDWAVSQTPSAAARTATQ